MLCISFLKDSDVIAKSETRGDRNKSVEKMTIEHKSVKRKGAEEGSVMDGTQLQRPRFWYCRLVAVHY